MNGPQEHGGVVVPLVTPATSDGRLDFAALDRLLAFQAEAKVDGLLLLGTTGEGPSVPRLLRRAFIEHVAAAARRRFRLYVNLQENSLADAIAGTEECFALGADAVAVLPPSYFPPRPAELAAWFRTLLDASPGPVLLYNIPQTTRVSIPLDVIGQLVDHPRLAGLKDSENDAGRHTELLRRFGGRDGFSLFCGVGSLMAQDLGAGMQGIVPSVGNLIPDDCRELVAASRSGEGARAARYLERMNSVANLYQGGRTLGQSLAAIKALLSLRGLCTPAVFPPLLPLPDNEVEALRAPATMWHLA